MTDGSEGRKSFVQRASFDADELVGARWWNESFEERVSAFDPDTRRQLLKVLAGGAVAVALGVAIAGRGCGEDEEVQVPMDALELQRRHGWNAGASAPLSFPYARGVDVDGGTDWRAAASTLAERLRPREARLLPYFVPTLFQSVQGASSEGLRQALRPIQSPSMEAAHGRGLALRRIFEAAGDPRTTAIVVDIPGPEAVAFAAALAPRFAPVFAFDNWPHPLGVVPAHLTLAACLTYLPRFEAADGVRPTPAPPLFVLDGSRLAPYRDDPATFDNRFVAKLPLDVGWKALGVQHVLYVRPEGAALQELDDLNEDFVALDRAGIDVKILPLSDFTRVVTHDAPASAVYHYGGSPHGHLHFWPRYGWYEPPRAAARISPAPLSQPVSPGPSYRPAPRPTIFASRSVGGGAGIGKQKPSGFGRVSVRYQASSGGFAGLGPRRGGGNAGRSGSFGRSRSSWSG